MTDQDRGAYAPQNDAPLAFDPRRVGERRGPPPITLILSALVLLLVAGGVFFLYRHGARHPGQPPQVVGAPVGDTKTAPLSSEAAADSNAGLQVYKTEVPPSGETAAFAPPPEQPQARPVTQAPPPPQPVAQVPLRAAEPAPTVAVAPPPKKAPPPQQVAEITPPQPIQPAAKAAPPPPKKTVVAATSSAPPAKKVTPPAVASSTPPAKKTTPPAASSQPPAPAGGGTAVQIGALPSQAAAEQAWSDVAHKAPGAMAGKGRKIETTQKDGKTYYRAYVTGFSSHAAALSFCGQLKAAGVSCIVH